MHCPLRAIRDSAALVISLCAMTMAAVYYLCRLGFSDNLPGPILMTLGLSWFLVNFPYAVKRLWKRAAMTPSWMASDGALSLVGLVAVMLLGMSFGKTAGVPVALCGALFLLVRCASLMGERWFRRTSEVLLWGALLGLCLACWIWGDGFHDPLFRWEIINGVADKDELCISSIANMIRTYGVPSTGLDGVPYYAYHYGSPFLLVQLGRLLDLPTIDVYQLIYPVVFLPLLIHSIVTAGLAFALPRDATAVPRSVLVWPTILVGLAGVLPLSAGSYTGHYPVVDLTSESMCMAAIVLLLGLAAGASLCRRTGGGSQPGMTIDRLLALIGFPALVAVLGFFKVSAMAVLLGASTLVCLSMAPFRRSRLAILSLVLAYGAFLVVSRMVVYPGAEKSPILPFAYLRRYVNPDWWGYYPLLVLQILLPAVALRLSQEKCSNVAELMRGWRSGALLDVGFLVSAAAVGFLPELILDIGGGSAAYFSTVQHWIALPILLSVLFSFGRQPPETLRWKERLSQLPLWKVGAWLLLLSVGCTLALDTLSRARELAHGNLTNRGIPRPDPSDTTGTGLRSSIKQALRRGNFGHAYALIREQAAAQEARRDAKAQTIDILVGLDRLPQEEKRITLLYIPKTNRAYWDLFGDDPLDRVRPPWATPFVAPALSGMACLDGLPDPEDFPPIPSYGYPVYDPSKRTHQRSDQSKEDLCRKAEAMGFRRVLVLDAGPDGSPLLQAWCFGGARPLLQPMKREPSRGRPVDRGSSVSGGTPARRE